MQLFLFLLSLPVDDGRVLPGGILLHVMSSYTWDARMAEAATCFTSLAGKVFFLFLSASQAPGWCLLFSFCRHTSDPCFLQGSLPGSVRARKLGGCHAVLSLTWLTEPVGSHGHGFSTWWCGRAPHLQCETVSFLRAPHCAHQVPVTFLAWSCLAALASLVRSRRWRFQGRHRQQNDATGKRNPVRVPGLADSELACAFFFLDRM